MSSPSHAAFDLTLSGALPHPLRDACGSRIECLSGRALITAYDVRDDIELGRGEAFLVPNDGLVLIEGVEPCRLRVRPARPRPGKPAGKARGANALRAIPGMLRDAAMRLCGRSPSGRHRASR